MAWPATALTTAVAVYATARLVAAANRTDYSGRHRAVDVAHVVMALGMAVMLSPVGGPLPMAAWQTVFLLIAVWFLAARPALPEMGWHGSAWHHFTGAAAMLYMLAAVPHPPMTAASAWMPAHTGEATHPWIAALFLALTALTAIPALRALARRPNPDPDILTCRRKAAYAQVAMALGMATMLAALL